MKLQILLMLGLLGTGATAIAQEQPNSAQYHAVHNPNSPHYVGSNQQPAAQQPTGYWEKTWGAIATDGVKSSLGSVVGVSSEKEAKQLALSDCEAKGGENCVVDLAYHNQCGALVVGSGYISTGNAPSENEAKQNALSNCKSGDSSCRVYYSACTEPIFHRY